MSGRTSPMDTNASCNGSVGTNDMLSTVSTAGSDVASCRSADQELAVQKEMLNMSQSTTSHSIMSNGGVGGSQSTTLGVVTLRTNLSTTPTSSVGAGLSTMGDEEEDDRPPSTTPSEGQSSATNMGIQRLIEEEIVDRVRHAPSACNSTCGSRSIATTDNSSQHLGPLQDVDERHNRVQGMFVSAWGDDETGVADDDLDQHTKKIMHAAEEGDLATLEAAIQADGAERVLAMRDSDGYSPLHRAAYNDHVDVVQRLLEVGADPMVRTNEDWTPLHCAACWANARVAQLLLNDARVDVNAKTSGKLTPLHLAAACTTNTPERVHDIVALLLKAPGVDARATNDAGDTPKDIAKRAHKHLNDLFEHL